MTTTLPQHAPDLPEGVRAVPLNGHAAAPDLVERLRSQGAPHQDVRDWLEMVDALGELKVLEGVDWQENIGRIAEMLVHSDGAPAVLFDKVQGYPAGYRVLVNAHGERPRGGQPRPAGHHQRHRPDG